MFPISFCSLLSPALTSRGTSFIQLRFMSRNGIARTFRAALSGSIRRRGFVWRHFKPHCAQLLGDGFAAELGAGMMLSGAVNFIDQRLFAPTANHRLADRSRPRHDAV